MHFTPPWHNGTLEKNHSLLLAFQYTNNEQSRLLQFYIPEMFRYILNLSIHHAYILQRWSFIFLVFIGFHFYLKKWFDTRGAFAGVLFLSCIMPLSYYDHLQESSPFLLLIFLLVLWAIREHKTFYYAILLAIGALNNETVLCLPLVFFCYNFKRLECKRLLRLILITLGSCFPAYLVVGIIRYLTRENPHLGGAWHWPDNIRGVLYHLQIFPLDYWKAQYLYTFFLFGAFWYYAVLNYSRKSLFLRRATIIIPVFLFIHFITGVIREVRQLLPLSFIIIPMALLYLFPVVEVTNDIKIEGRSE